MSHCWGHICTNILKRNVVSSPNINSVKQTQTHVMWINHITIQALKTKIKKVTPMSLIDVHIVEQNIAALRYWRWRCDTCKESNSIWKMKKEIGLLNVFPETFFSFCWECLCCLLLVVVSFKFSVVLTGLLLFLWKPEKMLWKCLDAHLASGTNHLSHPGSAPKLSLCYQGWHLLFARLV